MTLDTIIDATGSGSIPRPNQSISTATAISQFGRVLPFRGLLKNVRGRSGMDLLQTADLAWRVHTMPVGVIGKTQTKLAEDYQALVRGDNGEILTITSSSFKAHQNTEIMGDIVQTAELGDAASARHT